jgi:hypothetical protein
MGQSSLTEDTGNTSVNYELHLTIMAAGSATPKVLLFENYVKAAEHVYELFGNRITEWPYTDRTEFRRTDGALLATIKNR